MLSMAKLDEKFQIPNLRAISRVFKQAEKFFNLLSLGF